MEQPPQPPLDYRPPPTPGPPVAHPFFLGLIIGSVISAIAWTLLWSSVGQDMPNNRIWIIFAIPSLKLIFAMVCLLDARWKRFGAGLLTSIAIGFLIFFGLCANNVMHNI
jgi:hypothetical protein